MAVLLSCCGNRYGELARLAVFFGLHRRRLAAMNTSSSSCLGWSVCFTGLDQESGKNVFARFCLSPIGILPDNQCRANIGETTIGLRQNGQKTFFPDS